MKRLIALCLLLPLSVQAGPYLGDYNAGDTVCGYFNTYQPSTGASFTLASGVAAAYKDNSATQDTDGLTLDNDFDSITGYHQLCVDTSADGTFYSAGSRFSFMLSAGTVDSVSVVGTEVFSFSLLDGTLATIEAQTDDIGAAGAGLTEAGGTGDQFTAIDVFAISGDSTAANTLEALLDLQTSAGNGAFPAFGIVASGTAQAYTAGTPSITLASATAMADDDINAGATVLVAGSNESDWQVASAASFVGSTDVLTLSAALNTAPTGTISYVIFGTAAGAAGSLTASDVWAHATRSLTILDEDSTTIDLNATDVGAAASVTGAVGSVTGAVGSVTGAVGSVTGNVGGNVVGSVASVTGAVGSVTGAVGSVTGNVGGNVTGTVGGIAGTITTLDALDSAQDTQHGITQTAIDAVPTAAENATEHLSQQRVLTGTCDSGSTTTCVDNALTQADETQIDDRLICFSDSWCALITGFTPGSDTVTTTKVAPATRASLGYTIFPATAN